MPVAVRSLCRPTGRVPPLLILQTMQPVNWRLTDIAKGSHEDNVRVASVSVIPCTLRNVPLWLPSILHHFSSSPPTLGFSFLLTVKSCCFGLESNTKRATLQSCEISHLPLRALMGGAIKHTQVFVF